MKDKVIRGLVSSALICFILGTAYAFSSTDIHTSKAIPIVISFFLLLISMVLWNVNKEEDVGSPNYKPSINKVAIFIVGFLLFFLEKGPTHGIISVLQNVCVLALLFFSLLFELYRKREYRLKYFDRFMFSFSVCIFELCIYVFLFLLYNVFFDKYDSTSISQKMGMFLGLFPAALSRFFIGFFFGVILSSILPLFFTSSYHREESLILDEDEIKSSD